MSDPSNELDKVTIDSVELNMENDWIAIYGPKFHDYREWKVFQYVAFANDIQQNENSHVLSIEINDEGTIIFIGAPTLDMEDIFVWHPILLL